MRDEFISAGVNAGFTYEFTETYVDRYLDNTENIEVTPTMFADYLSSKLEYVTTHRQDLIPNEQEEVLDA